MPILEGLIGRWHVRCSQSSQSSSLTLPPAPCYAETAYHVRNGVAMDMDELPDRISPVKCARLRVRPQICGLQQVKYDETGIHELPENTKLCPPP